MDAEALAKRREERRKRREERTTESLVASASQADADEDVVHDEHEEEEHEEEHEEEEEEQEESDEETPLLDEDEEKQYVFRKAQRLPPSLVQQQDGATLWKVDDSLTGVSSSKDKLRLESGFYVGRPSHAAPANLSRLEQRLNKTANPETWFDEYGAIIRERNPLQPLQSHIPETGDVGHILTNTPAAPLPPHITLETLKKHEDRVAWSSNLGVSVTAGEVMMTGAGLEHYMLDVDVKSIKFHSHSLFIQEDELAAKLINLFNEYVRRKQDDNVTYYNDRITALTSAVEQIEEGVSEGVADLSNPNRLPGMGDDQPTGTPSRFRALARASVGKTEESEGLYVTSPHSSPHSAPTRGRSITVADTAAAVQAKDATLKRLRTEIRSMRQLRDADVYGERVAFKQMVKLWSQLKSLRKTQGFRATTVDFKAIEQRLSEADKRVEERERQHDITMEVEDMRQSHIDEYKETTAKWDNDRARILQRKKRAVEARLDRESKRRLRNVREARLRGSGVDEAVEEEDEDATVISEARFDDELAELGERPVFVEFDEIKARQVVSQRLLATKRRPGDPVRTPRVSDNGTVSSHDQLTATELERRLQLSKRRVCIRVSVNGKFVVESRHVPIEYPGFEARINELIPLSLSRWPEVIQLEVVEKEVVVGGVGAEKLFAQHANVYVHVPVEMVKSAETTDPYQFSGDTPYTPLWRLGADDTQPNLPGTVGPVMDSLVVSGSVLAIANWREGDDGMRRAPPAPAGMTRSSMKGANARQRVGMSSGGLVDPNVLKKWIDACQVDPTDPRNYSIFALLSTADAVKGKKSGYSIHSVSRDLLFDALDLPVPPRHTALAIRAKHHLPLKVPIDETELDLAQFTEADQPIDAAAPTLLTAKKQQRFKDRIRSLAVVQTAQSLRAETTLYSDIVREMPLPDISFTVEVLQGAFRQRRKLRPHRRERKVVSVRPASCMLTVDVRRGFNIPTRRFSAKSMHVTLPRSPRRGQAEQENEEESVREFSVMPFVEVAFQGHVNRTAVSPGSQPEWKETIELPFDAGERGYTPDNLAQVSETIAINLFDEVMYDISDAVGGRDVSAKRRERRWLGSVDIPLSTVYQNKHVQGDFIVAKPPIIIGYEAEAEKNVTDTSTDTMLSLFLTLDPPLPLESPTDEFDLGEDPALLRRAATWVKGIRRRAQCAKRNIAATAGDMDGRSVLITRYIKPQVPPLDNPTNQMLSRFVSMIPFIEDSASFLGRGNVWATSQQFIEILAGDWEEHAILLCNFLLHMKVDAWVVLGHAIPEGETAYVLTQESGQYFLWNAVTGHVFKSTNIHCPLRDVGVVFNQQNIWANIQTAGQPHRMKWNFADQTQWSSFFTAKFQMPSLTSKQADDLYFEETSSGYVKLIQKEVQETLRRRFEVWREKSRMVTQWNIWCGKQLEELLRDMEKHQCGTYVLNESEHNDKLRGTLSSYVHLYTYLHTHLHSYHMNGFPINMAYTDTEELCDKLFATRLHEIEEDSIQFALGVFVERYPSNVLSVWFYAASLLPKQ